MQDVPLRTTKLPDAARMEKYIDAVAGQTAGGKYAKLGSCMAATKPALLLTIRIYLFLSPYVRWVFKVLLDHPSQPLTKPPLSHYHH